MLTEAENIPILDSYMGEHQCLENCFDANCVGVFFIDTSRCLTRLNRRAIEIFGFESVEEAHGKPLAQLEFFLSSTIIERIRNLFNTDGHFKIDCFPGTNLTGHFAYYSLSCNCAWDKSGNIAGVFGIIDDVTEQEKKHQQLNNRINELSIVSQITQAVASARDTDEILNIILTAVTARQGLGFNRAFLFMLNEDGKFLEGHLAVGPNDAEEAGKIWAALESDDRTLVETLSIYRDNFQDGGTLNDRFRALRINLTMDSLFTKAIKEKESIVIDSDDEIDDITRRYLSKMGDIRVATTPLISRDRAIGLLVVDNAITGDTITDDDRRFLKLIADQTAAAVERSYLYKDLKDRALELEDMNKRLAATQNQIIEAEKMSVIGEITAAVAHELRNPLTIIGGFANLMNKHQPVDSPDTEYLNIIVSETQRAEEVLTDVLDFSKASRTRDACLDLNQLIKESINMLTVRLGQGRSRAKLSLGESNLPFWGNYDQMLYAFYQIFQVIMNDFDGSLIPIVSTCVCDNTLRMELSFENSKNNESQINKELRLYFGASNSTKRLSLIVAEETLKYHGGIFGIESDAHSGPILYIHLPRREEAENAQNNDS
ncbi:MAG: histidine kinase dimerization/phospho-acceptor domain-containing protein [candidate division Zixibacteria bacterium]